MLSLFSICILLGFANSKALGQTTLSPGDVAIVQYQADTPDEFAFITFVDLDAGTTIYFTDCGTVNGGSFLVPCNEGARVYVAPGAINAGSVVEYPGVEFSSHTDSRITGFLAMGTLGDQIIIFQDADGTGGTDPAQNPAFIFAFNAASTQFTGNPTNSNSETGLPQGLAGISNASLAVGSGTGPSDEVDNSAFNTSLAPFATLTAAQTAILNSSNWSPSNSIFTEPYATYAANIGSVEFLSSTTCPTVGAVSASETSTCQNSSFNITATGLANMANADNSDQDYGIKFVAFTSTPADPSVGGTDLGTVPFGSLTGGGTTAALIGATLSTSGTHEIYAILSPTPSDMICRPSAMTSIAVDALPVTSIADLTLCIDETTTATPSTGGTWSSQDPTRASITNAGIITALELGSTTFTFTDATTGCSATTSAVSISGVPGSVFISDDDICVNGTTTVGAVPAPQVNLWSSNDETVATVTNDGDVTGVSAGTTTFTYTRQSNGCTLTTTPLTVKANPTVSISGSSDICIGATTSLLPATGGTWASNAGTVASVADGVLVTGLSGGTVTFTFTETSSGCTATTSVVTVNADPVVSTTGDNGICIDETTTLSPSTGGTWASSDDNVATVANDGTVTGAGAGTATFTFTETSTGCTATTGTVTVNDLPTVSISGSTDICIGATTSLLPAIGGTWASSDDNVATVANDGTVTGAGAGTATFMFAESGTGCEATTETIIVNADPLVSFAPSCTWNIHTRDLNGNSWQGGFVTLTVNGVEIGDFTNNQASGNNVEIFPFSVTNGGTLDQTFTGGGFTWEVSWWITDDNDNVVFGTPNVANYPATTPPAAGGAISCQPGNECVEGQIITTCSNATPLGDLCEDAGVQTGQGGATPTGGVYSGDGVKDDGNGMTYSFDPSEASGAGVGTHTLIYTVTDANGCEGSDTDEVEVFATPTVAITGTATICVEATTTLSPTTGGTWTSSDDGVATVLDDGTVTGISQGTVTFTFTDGTTGCSSTTGSVIVNSNPTVSFTALPDLCVDDNVQTGLGGGMPTGGEYSGPGITDGGDGLTYSFDPSTGTGSGAGTHTIIYTYTDTNGCTGSDSDDVEVTATCNCFLGDNMFTGAIDGDWDKAGNWSLNCIPTSPYAGNLTIMSNVNTSSLGAFELTGNLIIESGATFEHANGNDFDMVGSISVLVGGDVSNTSTLTTTLGMTNAGTYSGKGIDGNFINNGVINIGGN